MQNVAHYGLVRDFRVVRMCVVDRIILAFTHIGGKGFSVIGRGRIIRLTIASDEVLNEWIGTRSIVRWIGKPEDVFVRADGETIDLPKLRVLQLHPQLLREVRTPRFITLEVQAKTLHSPRLGRRRLKG